MKRTVGRTDGTGALPAVLLVACMVLAAVACGCGGSDDADHAEDKKQEPLDALALLELAEAELAWNRDAKDKSSTCLYLAEARVAAGDKAGARETLRQAVKTCAAIKDSDARNWRYYDIAERQIKIGDIEGARATGARISSSSVARVSPWMLADAYAKAGDMARALATARSDRGNGAWAFEGIAKIQADRGDKAGALATLQLGDRALAATPNITVERWAKHLMHNARIENEVGNKTASLRTLVNAAKYAGEVSDPKRKLYLLCQIASMLASAGDKAAARQAVGAVQAVVGKISSSSDRNSVTVAIAATQCDVGDISGAMQTASELTHQDARADAYLAIVEALCRTRHFAEAGAALAKITASRERKSRLLAVAWARLQADDITGALAVAERIGGKTPPVEVYVAVAEAQERTGDKAAALATLRRAADGMREGTRENHYYLVHALARMGDAGAARDLAKRVSAGGTAKVVACSLALAGDIDGALAAADTIQDDCWGLYGQYLRVARAVTHKTDDPTRVAKLMQWVQRRDADWRTLPNYHDIRCGIFMGAAQGLLGLAEWGDVLGSGDSAGR